MKRFSVAIVAASIAAGALATVESSNTFAQMSVSNNGQEWTLLALPWVTPGSSDSQDIVLTNLVLTTGLAENDLLMRYNGTNYDCWKINSESKWEAVGTADASGTTVAADPQDVSFPRGIGVWLKRGTASKDSPILLYGQVKSDDYPSVTVPANSTALLASPKATDLELGTWANGGAKDMIRVSVNGNTKYYYWKSTPSGWCTNGIAIKNVGGLVGTITQQVYGVTTDKIPAGLGFFYTNGSKTDARQIQW